MTSPLIDQIEERAAELEAANSSLRRRVAGLEDETHDLAEDLQAARTMNRELMSELNRSSSDDAVGPGEAHPGPRSSPPPAASPSTQMAGTPSCGARSLSSRAH